MAFHLQLPLTLSVLRSLLVEIGGHPDALPLARLERLLVLPREQVTWSRSALWQHKTGSK